MKQILVPYGVSTFLFSRYYNEYEKRITDSRPLWGIYISIQCYNEQEAEVDAILVPYGVSTFLFFKYGNGKQLKFILVPYGVSTFLFWLFYDNIGMKILILVPYGVSTFLFPVLAILYL